MTEPSRRDQLLAQIAALDEALTRKAEVSLHEFVKQSWPTVEPQRPFSDNWHLGAICEHLDAVTRGQIHNLGINVPPSTGKSTVVSVQFPAWIWLPRVAATPKRILGPQQRIMCASYDLTQTGRDQTRMRDLVLSDWYQERWPVQLRADMQGKMKFGTVDGGWRMGVAVSAPRMGEHPNIKIVDDPHNPRKLLLSDADIADAQQFYSLFKIRGAMFPAPTVLIMQRLHEQDLCGHLRETEGGEWEWLVLPMRWEPKRMVQLSTGWLDPRDPAANIGTLSVAQALVGAGAIPRGEGALLWPKEWPESRTVTTYPPGSWIEASQAQQRPAPAGGLMFKRSQFPIIHARPADIVATVRSWDIAGTELKDKTPTSARTAGVKMSRTAGGLYVIEDVRKGWWGAAEVDLQMLQTAQLDGRDVPIWEEREGGSAGKAVIAARRRLLAGYAYREYLLGGRSKPQRATPMQAQAQGGNMRILVPLLPDGQPEPSAQQMAEEFLREVELFPAGTLKDQIDAATQAFNVLTGNSVSVAMDFVTGADDAVLTEDELQEREALRTAEAERVVLADIAAHGVYWPTGQGGGSFGDR